MAWIDAHQAYKRMHQSNMQYTYVQTALLDLRQHAAVFDSFFGENRHRVENSARLEMTARQALAQRAFWAASQAFDDQDPISCQQLLDYARELDPALVSRPEWSRLRWKRRMGVTGWGIARPWVDRLRGKRKLPAVEC
jgi:hypothetical protein